MDAPRGDALSAALPHRCLAGGRRGPAPHHLRHAAWGRRGRPGEGNGTRRRELERGKGKEGPGGNVHDGEKRWSPGAEGATGTQSHSTWESSADAGLKVKASKRMKAQAHALLLVCNREGPWGRHPQPSVPTRVPWPLPTARCLMRASDLLSRSLPGLINSLLCSDWPLLPIT